MRKFIFVIMIILNFVALLAALAPDIHMPLKDHSIFHVVIAALNTSGLSYLTLRPLGSGCFVLFSAAIVELAQGMFFGRTASVSDMALNIIGVLVGLIGFMLSRRGKAAMK